MGHSYDTDEEKVSFVRNFYTSLPSSTFANIDHDVGFLPKDGVNVATRGQKPTREDYAARTDDNDDTKFSKPATRQDFLSSMVDLRVVTKAKVDRIEVVYRDKTHFGIRPESAKKLRPKAKMYYRKAIKILMTGWNQK